jgi:hypothetical protein
MSLSRAGDGSLTYTQTCLAPNGTCRSAARSHNRGDRQVIANGRRIGVGGRGAPITEASARSRGRAPAFSHAPRCSRRCSRLRGRLLPAAFTCWPLGDGGIDGSLFDAAHSSADEERQQRHVRYRTSTIALRGHACRHRKGRHVAKARHTTSGRVYRNAAVHRPRHLHLAMRLSY